jgi:medium-chain acyl-[acyl-carrier-protein] hydrolase
MNIRNRHQIKGNKKVNLICLPYAGGSSHYFEPIQTALQTLQENHQYSDLEIQVIEVILPGRGARYHEPLLKNIDDLIADIWKQIQHLMHYPYAFFGHSMGALLVYQLTHRAKKMGFPTPMHLFLSGRKAPSIPSDNEKSFLLPLPALKNKLKNYGGINTVILEDNDIFSFFEPIIRADFEVVETWKYRYCPLLNVPVTVFSGTKEEITSEELKAWKKEFENEVQFKTFKGGHFFINDHAQEIATIMIKKLQLQPQGIY